MKDKNKQAFICYKTKVFIQLADSRLKDNVP